MRSRALYIKSVHQNDAFNEYLYAFFFLTFVNVTGAPSLYSIVRYYFYGKGEESFYLVFASAVFVIDLFNQMTHLIGAYEIYGNHLSLLFLISIGIRCIGKIHLDI